MAQNRAPSFTIPSMPRALAIETSGQIGSIALADGGRVIAAETFPHGLRHAAEIIPLIERQLRAHGLTVADLEHLYVSAGPGSFTGLRIGITVAKTLAFATGIKIVAVPTVRVLALNAPAEARHLIIVLDAKREQIFTARFERADGDWIEREPAHLDSLAAMIGRSPRPVHLLGEGIKFHEKFIPQSGDVIVTAPGLWQARAEAVVALGTILAAEEKFADPFTLTPLYIRRPEAEEKFEQHRSSQSP
jgi:tRNA threonylcarbamoyladenosine biosynthesis protein TsaB